MSAVWNHLGLKQRPDQQGELGQPFLLFALDDAAPGGAPPLYGRPRVSCL